MRYLAILLVLFAAGTASADKWWYTTELAIAAGPPTAAQRAGRVTAIRPGQSAYYRSYGTETTDSTLLNVSQCKAFTALWYRTGSAAEAHLWDNQVDGDVRTTTSTKILNDSGDLDLTGSAATGLAFIYNITGVSWIWVEITTAAAGTDYGTMRITCQPSE